MSKISELSDGGVIQGGDTLIAVRSGGNVKVTYGGSTTANIDGGTIDGTTIGGTTPAAGNFTTGSFTGNVTFGDNDKAVFGAGSDLQVYHSGSHSYIDEVGTGNLYVRSTKYRLANADGSKIYMTADDDTFVQLYDNNNAIKLATTATGIDVTGTVTADGLTVGDTSVGQSLVQMLANPTNGANTIHFGDGASADAYVGYINYAHDSNSMQFAAGGAERLRITSAGNLLHGITGVPTGVLLGKQLVSSSPTGSEIIAFREDTSVDVGDKAGAFLIGNSDTDGAEDHFVGMWGKVSSTNGSQNLHFAAGRSGYEGDSPQMTLDSSGNLLVGKTSLYSTDQGIHLDPDGTVYGTRPNNASGVFNRKTSDGNIVIFEKDGTTTVGSIGCYSGDLTIGNGNTVGLIFEQTGSDRISPWNLTTNATRDGEIDLGDSNQRFKDIYLSGSVTSGANGGLIKEIGGDTSVVQGAVGLRINDAASAISPTTASANNDASVDLGVSNIRFKDLYLSGNVTHGTTPSSSAQGVFTESFGRTSYSRGSGTGGFAHLNFINGNGTIGSVVTTGSATAYNTSSDYRLKENVVAISGATERLKQLAPKRFNFIADADTTVDGFLAHEVADVVPEAVTGAKDAMRDEEYEVTPAVLDDDGNVVTEAVMGTHSVPDYQGIDQAKLVPLLVATIQELEARITALETN